MAGHMKCPKCDKEMQNVEDMAEHMSQHDQMSAHKHMSKHDK